MTTSNISAALVKAQRAFGPALKDKTNPAFKSKYADLGACIEAVMESLNTNGIALIQKQHPHEGGVSVETVFVHESGETFSAGILSVPASKQDPQGYGSALTYARRYSLMAACGIAPEDDDGNAASKPRSAPAKPEVFDALRVANNIETGIAAGDASGAASYLSGLPDTEYQAVWALLGAKQADALVAAWPQGAAT
jgi:hypothetical protein